MRGKKTINILRESWGGAMKRSNRRTPPREREEGDDDKRGREQQGRSKYELDVKGGRKERKGEESHPG